MIVPAPMEEVRRVANEPAPSLFKGLNLARFTVAEVGYDRPDGIPPIVIGGTPNNVEALDEVHAWISQHFTGNDYTLITWSLYDPKGAPFSPRSGPYCWLENGALRWADTSDSAEVDECLTWPGFFAKGLVCRGDASALGLRSMEDIDGRLSVLHDAAVGLLTHIWDFESFAFLSVPDSGIPPAAVTP